MKKVTLLGAFLMMIGLVNAQISMEEAFKQADQIVQSIKKTNFPDKTFRITDFGAVANNP